MRVDIEHVLFWMDAIRNSDDRYRTLESFWKGQVHSKVWLLDELSLYINNNVFVDIYGGWNGVLASLMFQSGVGYKYKYIRSIDIDPKCEPIANTVNKIEEMNNRFRAVTGDMLTIRSDANIIINTSCEHISQHDYDLWLSGLPHNSLIVLQSNNYKIDEHIRTADNIDHFIEQSQLKVLTKATKSFEKYDRYLIIGKVCTN